MKIKNAFLIFPVLLCCSFTPRVFGNVSITLAATRFDIPSVNNPLNNFTTWENNGQAFLIIKNDYSFPLDMGYFDLGPFTSITVGLFPPTIYNNNSLKKGIFYNREAYHFKKSEMVPDGGVRGVTVEIPTYQFEQNIINENNEHLFEYYDDTYNFNSFDSVDFAIGIFNRLTNQNLYEQYVDSNAYNLQLKLILDGYVDNIASSALMPNPTSFFCFDQNNNFKHYYASMGD